MDAIGRLVGVWFEEIGSLRSRGNFAYPYRLPYPDASVDILVTDQVIELAAHFADVRYVEKSFLTHSPNRRGRMPPIAGAPSQPLFALYRGLLVTRHRGAGLRRFRCTQYLSRPGVWL